MISDIDRDSSQSVHSTTPLVETLVFSKEISNDDRLDHDDSSLSSVCSSNTSEMAIVSPIPLNIETVTGIDTIEQSLVPQQNLNNVSRSVSNQLYIPEGYNSIYYSSDSDANKINALI